MNKFVIIDPHADDFIFKPLSFIFVNRAPLRKYKYLHPYFESSYYITGTTSSLPHSLNKKLPPSILKLLNILEIFFWRALNNLKSSPLKKNKILNSHLFLFAYKKIDEVLNHLDSIKFQGKLYVHLSHYHLFNIDERWFDRFDITLTFDADITDVPFFKEKFPFYKKKLLLIPFQISEKFENVDIKNSRKLRVFVTGTYHKIKDKIFGVQVDGFSTLHPHRLEFSQLENLPSYVVNKLSLYESNSKTNPFLMKQKKYFSFNMKDELCFSSHAFVGSEITGAMGIGTVEAMACGCIVFITKHEFSIFSKNGISPDCVIFNNINDLYNSIMNLKVDSYYVSDKNKVIASSYYGLNLFNKFLEIADNE